MLFAIRRHPRTEGSRYWHVAVIHEQLRSRPRNFPPIGQKRAVEGHTVPSAGPKATVETPFHQAYSPSQRLQISCESLPLGESASILHMCHKIHVPGQHTNEMGNTGPLLHHAEVLEHGRPVECVQKTRHSGPPCDDVSNLPPSTEHPELTLQGASCTVVFSAAQHRVLLPAPHAGPLHLHEVEKILVRHPPDHFAPPFNVSTGVCSQ